MWKYSQTTGRLETPEGKLACIGYAGNGLGKNNPKMQHMESIGPLPRGFYKIGLPYESRQVGPFALPLTPFPENKMYGRGAFRIHGDSIKHPGTASKGCIIAPRKVREEMAAHEDDVLEVVE